MSSDIREQTEDLSNQEQSTSSKGNLRAWITIFALVLAAILSIIDRQILSLLVPAIKADLNLSDTEISLLQGFAFAVFYAIAAVPLGWLADRKNRKNIVAIGVVSWSFMTALCGMASNFFQLLLARMGVGVGEATLSACAHSMIADLFERKKLPLAMAFYGVGATLGASLAFIVGGQVIDYLSKFSVITMPIIGEIKPWQAVFIIVGLPGVLLGILIALFIKEPGRNGLPAQNDGFSTSGESLGQFVKANLSVTTKVILGVCFLTATTFSILAWIPAFFQRIFLWSASDVGLTIGLIMVFCSLPGGILTGYIAGKLAHKDIKDAALLVMAITALVSVPFQAIAFILDDSFWVLVFILVPMFMGSAYVGLAPAAIQSVVPGHLRAQVAAWQLLTTSLVGMVSGPLLVALLTDGFFKDEQMLGYSLSIATSLFSIAGGTVLLSARKDYRKLIAEVE